MGRHQWIVSDPPHREVDLDAAAERLGLAKPEARMKANFWAPEVWLAYSDVDQASEAAGALRAAGLNVTVIAAQDLLSVPPPNSAESFSFTDDGLVAFGEDGEVHLPYDAPLIGSFCRPPADFQAGDPKGATAREAGRSIMGGSGTGSYIQGLVSRGGSSLAQQTMEKLERTTNLDLYFPRDAGLGRISIAEGVVDFSGLGDAVRPRARDNMDLFLAECERRFTNLVLDKRMVNVRPRRRLTVGEPTTAEQEMRRLLTFGTVGLQSLLESVSPELADITNFELGSRLSYLMLRQSDAVGAGNA